MNKKVKKEYIALIVVAFMLGVGTAIYNYKNTISSYIKNGYFSEGLATFYKNEKFGYIDESGNIVIEPQYKKAWYFSEGLAWVEIEGKYGYIDKSGKVVIDAQYDEAKNFKDGSAKVQVNGQWKTIDKKGNIKE